MYRLKHYILPAILGIFLLIPNLKSQNLELINDFEIGLQPLEVIYSQSTHYFYIFCDGADTDYNGSFDEGETKASVWKVDAYGAYPPIQVNEFDDFLVFPLRIGVDSANDKYAVPFYNGISTFDSKMQLLNSNIAESQFTGTYFLDADRLLLFHQPPDYTANGSVRVWNLEYSTMLTEITTYPNPVDAVTYEETENSTAKQRLAVLSSGVFGSSNSILQIFSVDGNNFTELDTLQLGDTGNRMVLSYPYLYVVMNGSHAIQVVDLQERKVVRTISTGTNGYEGPREMVISGNYGYVTTYYSQLMVFNLTTGDKTAQYDLPGNAEGITLGPDGAVVLAIPGGYANPMSTLRFYHIMNTYVEDYSRQTSDFAINPNPCKEQANFTNKSDKAVQCTIFDIRGTKVTEFNCGANASIALRVSDYQLPAGVYHILAEDGKQSKILPFVINK